MKQNPWKLRRRIEADYAAAITKFVLRLLREAGPLGDPFLFRERLRVLARSPTAKVLAKKAAMAMLTHLAEDNARTWREAARRSSKGRTIYEALKKELVARKDDYWPIIERNSEYITSLPDDLAERASRTAAENTASGARAGDMAKELMQLCRSLTTSRAKLIARTETSKAQAALTHIRAERLGLHWYEWCTSDDERVRKSHHHMAGVLVRFDDPPAPEILAGQKSQGRYNAGEIYNCRCYAAPLTDIGDVHWPHKVYWGGRIVHMTRKEFKERM